MKCYWLWILISSCILWNKTSTRFHLIWFAWLHRLCCWAFPISYRIESPRVTPSCSASSLLCTYVCWIKSASLKFDFWSSTFFPIVSSLYRLYWIMIYRVNLLHYSTNLFLMIKIFFSTLAKVYVWYLSRWFRYFRISKTQDKVIICCCCYDLSLGNKSIDFPLEITQISWCVCLFITHQFLGIY